MNIEKDMEQDISLEIVDDKVKVTRDSDQSEKLGWWQWFLSWFGLADTSSTQTKSSDQAKE